MLDRRHERHLNKAPAMNRSIKPLLLDLALLGGLLALISNQLRSSGEQRRSRGQSAGRHKHLQTWESEGGRPDDDEVAVPAGRK